MKSSSLRFRFIFLFALVALPLNASAESTSLAAFVDVTVVPMDRQRLLPHQTVLVRGNRIVEIGPADRVALPRRCSVIDGRNRYLIPGLTDAHVHFRGYTESHLHFVPGAADQRRVLLLLLANGITTAINMEGFPEILTLRDQVARGDVLGPKLYTTGPFIEMPAFQTAEQVREEVIAEKRAGYDFVKVHGELPEDAYLALLQTAHEQGTRVVGHVPSNLGIDAALNGHQSLIVHAEEFLYSYFQFHRDLPTDPAEIEKMVKEVSERTAQAGTWVSPMLFVFRQIIFQVADIDAFLQRPEMRYLPSHPTTGAPGRFLNWYPANNPYIKCWPLQKIPYLRSQYSVMQRLVRGLRDAGVPLLAGTDPFVPCVIPGFSMRDELEQLYEAGLTPFEVFQSATSNAARFLGMSDDTGTVAPGKIADLVLLDANPLDDVANIFRQDGVMLAGRWFPKAELQSRLSETASLENSTVKP